MDALVEGSMAGRVAWRNGNANRHRTRRLRNAGTDGEVRRPVERQRERTS
jgi:hypothetical protein